VTTWLFDSYSDKGPAPRDPASMLRSYLLFLLTNPTIGITEWVNELYRVPLYAIISGFEPSDIPGVGTFYDFFHVFGAIKVLILNLILRESAKRRKRKSLKRVKNCLQINPVLSKG
jgi:hypothetical protein